VEAGYRGSFIESPGYAPFSTNDALPEFSLTASRTLASMGHVSFAAGASWDFGGRSAAARSDHASITVHRLTVPLEGRLHLPGFGYVFVRAAPGVAGVHAELDDDAAPAPLSKTQWLFATDVSGGLAWLVAPTRREHVAARVWLQADGGYGFVAGERLNLGPDLASGDLRSVSGVDLGDIDLGGGFFRIAAAISF
jgi:hypothetical protein